MHVIDVRSTYRADELTLRVVFDVPYEERSHCWEYSNVRPPLACGPFGCRLAAYIESSNVDEAKAKIKEFIEFWTEDNSCAQYELAQQTLSRVREKLGRRWGSSSTRADFRITDLKGFEYPLHPTDLTLNVDELALRIERARTEWIERKAKEKEKHREHARNIRETAIALREYFHIKDKEKHGQEQIVADDARHNAARYRGECKLVEEFGNASEKHGVKFGLIPSWAHLRELKKGDAC
jgi:hypothetical protein